MPSLRRIAFFFLLGALPTLPACRQGINERCQVDSDCRNYQEPDGLQCVLPAGGNIQEGGTCQPRATVDATVPPEGGAGDGGTDGLEGGAPDLTGTD